jgi:hypothetical protein
MFCWRLIAWSFSCAANSATEYSGSGCWQERMSNWHSWTGSAAHVENQHTDFLTPLIWRAMLFKVYTRKGDTKSPSPLKGLCTEGGDDTLKSATYAVKRIQKAKKAGVDALAFLLFGVQSHSLNTQ